MARLARKERADMRAMEEQNARVTMRGRGAIVGAGATPSMGLSQFRGGGLDNVFPFRRRPPTRAPISSREALVTLGPNGHPANILFGEGGYDNDDSSSSDEECKCKMCGGAVLLPARGAPAGYSARLLPEAPRNALIPYRPPARPPTRAPTAPASSRGALVTLGPSGRPPAYPSMPRSYYEGLYANRPTAPTAKAPVLSAAQKTTIARLLAAGVPLAALGAYLGDSVAQSAKDSGYYDDYVDNTGLGGDMGVGDNTGLGDNAPIDLPAAPIESKPISEKPAPPKGGPHAGPPPKLTKKEIKFYLQSGNLPDRFYSDASQRFITGSGKLDGRSARAEVVRKVMRDKGMKLIEASKYVKENGLYKK